MVNKLSKGLFVILFLVLHLGGISPLRAEEKKSTKKVVLIAGKKSHGPEGNGIHDYPWSVRLLKVMLDNSNISDKVRVEFHLDGWPKDQRTLEDADTIMVISDGRDGDNYAEAPYLETKERVAFMARQMARGCGFLTFHFSTFAPDQYAVQVLKWSGGYFDWETDGKRQWYSAIQTITGDVQIGADDHPICSGLKPFRLREEFYYNIRFNPQDKALKPILIVPALKGREPDGNVVAWARQREDGGRGFGTTCGHFYDNWQNDSFRKMILNALAWTAGVELPKGGVEARYYTHEEVLAALRKSGAVAPARAEQAIKAVIVTGHQHPAHAWRDTTPALREVLGQDSRFEIKVMEDPEFLAKQELHTFAVVVFNYCNWERPGLSEAAKQNLVKYLNNGGGLALIHFANGAFHFSLPKAKDSDWPEWRTRICRRVWDHTPGKSGHDKYGKFTVEITTTDHPITQGLKSFETTDELYYRQQGDQPVGVLATARSQVTGQTEPMAFVYDYGKGRIFQTILGHDAAAIRNPGTAELIRRGTVWAAGRTPLTGTKRSTEGGIVPAPPAPAGPSSTTELDYQPADAKLKAVLIDRSPNESYVAIKTDTTGRIFVGGREALFVFEPNATRRTIAKIDIEERLRSSVSPMPAGIVKTPQELRDLLAYLLSDNPLLP